jgi:hypothetical protein
VTALSMQDLYRVQILNAMQILAPDERGPVRLAPTRRCVQVGEKLPGERDDDLALRLDLGSDRRRRA